MIPRYNPTFLAALALGLLLGCGSGSTASAQPTPSPLVRAPTAAAPASPAPSASPLASPVAAGSPAPSASPRVATAPRAQLGPGSPAIDLQLVTNALKQPIYATHAGDGSGRLFVVEKQGRIVIVRDGAPLPTPFLDITSLVGSGGSEQGLFSVTFHPSYTSNGLFYVDYTDRNGDSVIARYHVSADNPDIADPDSAATLLHVDQPYPNHNGGLVLFGPDGYLWTGFGDGGSGGDPRGNGQNKSVLLGKLLRLDVDHGSPYAIPPDNPFVNEPDARPEIWAYGLRNPWRFSFDRATGDLYIGDVGQSAWEEVDFQPAGSGGGQNYGWNRMEGRHCYPPRSSCDPAPFVQPVAEFATSPGASVIGGYVYRGPSFPQLSGLYFFGDYCSGQVRAIQEQAPGVWQQELLASTPVRISSFGEDQAGELYLTSLSDNGLYRLVAAS